MLRGQMFLLVLSVALVAASGFPSPLGYISSGFRNLADYKLATTARLASYFTGDRESSSSSSKDNVVVKDVAMDPDEGGASEHVAPDEPDVDVSVEMMQRAPAPPPSKPQMPVEGPASADEVPNFKKEFAAGYAALDYANQLEKQRLAASSTTAKPSQYDAQVLPVPLEHYKGYVTGGDTGGSLMRVAVVAQDVPKPFYSPQQAGDAAEQWNQQGASPPHPEQSMEQHHQQNQQHHQQDQQQYQHYQQQHQQYQQQHQQYQQQHQQQPEDPRTEQASASYSGNQHQGHIFPYGGWQAAQPAGYPTYPDPSYHAVETGSEGGAEHSTGDHHATYHAKHHADVVPGSQFPQMSDGTPDSEPAQQAVEATPPTHAMESDAPEGHQGPRYRRDNAVAEVKPMESHPVTPEADRDIRGHVLGAPGPFSSATPLDLTHCLAKIFCTMAAQPSVFGPDSHNITEYFRALEHEHDHPANSFFKQASAVGSMNEDCENLFEKCRITTEQLKMIWDSGVAL